MITIIEATIVSFLSDRLSSSHVYAERPVNPPDEYYIIEKTASDEENHIRQAMIAVQSISKVSLLNAALMSKAAEAAMKRFPEVEDVGSCRLNTAYNFTDPETKEYRYQAVFEIHYIEGE